MNALQQLLYCRIQLLRRQEWMVLSAIAAVFLLSLSSANAQTPLCTSNTYVESEYEAVEQTVCISTAGGYVESANASPAPDPNDPYSEVTAYGVAAGGITDYNQGP
jgi:hypothetical protein